MPDIELCRLREFFFIGRWTLSVERWAFNCEQKISCSIARAIGRAPNSSL